MEGRTSVVKVLIDNHAFLDPIGELLSILVFRED